MDDSDLSFFDDPEFKFAKEDKNIEDERNRIDMNFFASEVLEDTELTGYVYLDIPLCLRAGSIFLRIESTEELCLERKYDNEDLKEKLKILRDKVINESLLNEITAKNHKSKDIKKNMVMPTSVNTSNRAYDPLLLKTPSPQDELIHSSYTRCILDVEAFVADYEISKSTVLVLPFRIQLRGKLNKSCELYIDNTTYLAHGRRRQMQALKKMPLDVASQISSKNAASGKPTSGQRQYIKLIHKIMAYYAAKNDVHIFNQVQSNISDDERNKIRYETLQKSDYFMSSVKEFKVVPNFRQINYKKHNRKGEASIAQDNLYLLCCTKKVKLSVNICLDLINLRNQDSSLNFVMKFERKILDEYLYLDVVIYSRLTQTSDDDYDECYAENICMVQSFDLDRKLPLYSPHKMVEYVQKLDLIPIQGKYQSVCYKHVKIEYFIKFYLSTLALRLNLEVLEIPLNFFKITNDFRSQENDEITDNFDKVEVKTKDSKIGVMLPYALIDFSTNVRGNGIHIENEDYLD